MTIDQRIEPVWGASPPTQQRWGLQETLVAVGVAAVIAGLGGAAISAATGSPTQQAFGHGMAAGPPGGVTAAQHLAGSPTTLHGEYVVAAGSGFATKLTQTGTVTAISPTAITVTSADGFTHSYELKAAAHTDRTIAVSDQVSIRGTRTGRATTATSIDIHIGPGGPVGPPGPAPHN